ncbi:MAG: hypothetical protein WC489_01330 [Patescibacteria group bacterium]
MFLISVYIDTSCINAKQEISALNELEKLNDEEKIIIETTDTLETELRDGKGYPRGLKKASNYIFSEGPAVVGHSRLGSCIAGSDEDDRRMTKVLEILFGKKARNKYTKNEIRDVMHVCTAIRYGGTYFVTLDTKILKRSPEIKNEFQIIIAKPNECLNLVQARLAKSQRNQ